MWSYAPVSISATHFQETKQTYFQETNQTKGSKIKQNLKSSHISEIEGNQKSNKIINIINIFFWFLSSFGLEY
jgi:hypothetical protein